jgi:hypothetical protein
MKATEDGRRPNKKDKERANKGRNRRRQRREAFTFDGS